MLKLLKIYRAIFARKSLYWLNMFLYRCSLSGLGILNYESDKLSGERNFLKKYFKNSQGGVVLDVGANVGSFSKAILDANSQARVFAFEPHPVTFKQLAETLNRPNVVLLNFALGAECSLMTLYDYEEEDGSSHASLYKDVIENIHKAKSVTHEVKVVTLDCFLKENMIDYISLLKIDTEGHELAVLTGAIESISAERIKAIQFEFNEMNVSSRTFFRDFWNLLPNYEFYRLLPRGAVKIEQYNPMLCEIFAYQNIVAILRSTNIRL